MTLFAGHFGFDYNTMYQQLREYQFLQSLAVGRLNYKSCSYHSPGRSGTIRVHRLTMRLDLKHGCPNQMNSVGYGDLSLIEINCLHGKSTRNERASRQPRCDHEERTMMSHLGATLILLLEQFSLMKKNNLPA